MDAACRDRRERLAVPDQRSIVDEVRWPEVTYARTGVVLALFIGCGGPAVETDLDEAFRAIQVHEATIAHRSAQVEACERGAPCPAEQELCDAVQALCTVSASIDDADATTRCRSARRRCPEGE